MNAGSRFEALAELAVHGANVQSGQIVAVNARVGQEQLARAVAAAAYRRGAVFVDVAYFDPWVKRARIENADPDTLGFVPPWYGGRLEALDALAGLDPELAGRDALPWLKETSRIVSERSTNWTAVPCPHPAWASL